MAIRVEGATRTRKKSALDSQLAGNKAVTYSDEDLEDKKVEGDTLKLLQTLAQQLIDASQDVVRATMALRIAEARFTDISEDKLPALMEPNGIPRFEFFDKTSGRTLIIKFESNKWRVTMPPKKDKEGNEYPDWESQHSRIFKDLRDGGNGAVIEKDIKIPVGLSADEITSALTDLIKEHYPELDPMVVEGVNQKRLQALINRLLKDGKNVPADLDIRPIRRATVSPAK